MDALPPALQHLRPRDRQAHKKQPAPSNTPLRTGFMSASTVFDIGGAWGSQHTTNPTGNSSTTTTIQISRRLPALELCWKLLVETTTTTAAAASYWFTPSLVYLFIYLFILIYSGSSWIESRCLHWENQGTFYLFMYFVLLICTFLTNLPRVSFILFFFGDIF